jgi:hypothetical protein
MQNMPRKKKLRRSSMGGIRILITTTAVAATLSFWALFARQNMILQALALKVGEPVQEVPAQDAVIILPPMPTLIPQLPESSGLVSSPSVPDINPDEQTFQEGVKVLLGGQAPQALRSQRSAPIPFTTTQSSR